MSCRVGLTGLVVLALLGGASPARGWADVAPLQLVSVSAAEQADSASEPALSAGGGFVAFVAEIAGLKGVFRKDLTTGAVTPVFAVDAYKDAQEPSRVASAPSISADGRYVSFTTATSLDPGHDEVGSTIKDSDVYVADMSLSPPAYELASAANGSSAGLLYGSVAGAVASGRAALTASGREVVFVTAASSNLSGDPAKAEAPEGQVAVRDLDLKTTTLVSARREAGAMTNQPVPGGAVLSRPSRGASISADGSTVAWLGINVASQAPTLVGDGTASATYNEPLWRRLPTAGDPLPPTRRIVGGSDPLALGCPANGTLQEPACQGPFPDLTKGVGDCTEATGWARSGASSPSGAGQPPSVSGLPQLSADGDTVGLIGAPEGFSNVFVVDMAPGLSRRQAMRRLTREVPIENPCLVGVAANVPTAGDIFELAISPDGRRLAFTTARREFPLAPPALSGSLPGGVGLPELYAIDLDAETVTRITGVAGEPSRGAVGGPGAAAPSFSADDRRLAFASPAPNLVRGDANAASDVFLASETVSPGQLGVSSITPPPVLRSPRVDWRLSISTASRPDGSVRVFAAVPGAGRLLARAGEQRVHGAPRPRRLAVASRRAAGARVVSLLLRPHRRFRRLVASSSGLPATVQIVFSSPGHRPLREDVEILFKRHQRRGGR